ncbi:Conserved_hypothetical protein [Hexamita inflata]|uniref:Dynein assembly factor 3 C-terminal domain-containing protein n=1 Tax=Hexamita inflata TaxID=28002 RepID=A0AA86QF61_9EUKA|nr:Conserved hypothetical protein [Hexamita inflata]
METGYGNTQNWGFAPALQIAENQATILVDNGDFRYILENLNTKTQFYMYERNICVIARLIMKYAILVQLRFSETLEQAIQVAHSYQELHSNIYISQQTVELINRMSQILINHLAGRDQKSELDTKISQILEEQVDISNLKSSERDDLFDFYTHWYNQSSLQIQQIGEKKSVESTGYKIPVKTEKQLQSFTDSFTSRLKNFYTDRYDRRGAVCLWDYSFRLQRVLPFQHEIFYQQFRTQGTPYLRPYFRLPKCLGGERQSGVAKRAPSDQESRMFCGYANVTLQNAHFMFDGDLTVGPWFESQYRLLSVPHSNQVQTSFISSFLETLNVNEMKEEFQQTFLPGGPGSDEPILCQVELGVVNLLISASFLTQKVIFLSTFGLKKSKFEQYFEKAVLSLEGLRYVKDECTFIKNGAEVIGELPYFVPQVTEQEKFFEQMKTMSAEKFTGYTGINSQTMGREAKNTHFKCTRK